MNNLYFIMEQQTKVVLDNFSQHTLCTFYRREKNILLCRPLPNPQIPKKNPCDGHWGRTDVNIVLNEEKKKFMIRVIVAMTKTSLVTCIQVKPVTVVSVYPCSTFETVKPALKLPQCCSFPTSVSSYCCHSQLCKPCATHQSDPNISL